MTREEALKIIKNGRIVAEQIRANDKETTKYNLENIEALNMAVEALEQESTLDKIRVEITTLQNRCYALTKGAMCTFCKYECQYKAESEEV